MVQKVIEERVQRRQKFLFCTGIENSYPTITDKRGNKVRIDQMEKCGHYDLWKDDFALVRELGLEYLRYGPPYYSTHLGPGRYDWSFTDEAYAELRQLGIKPITDLCHFGVPDWIGDFQNTDWPELFAEYAGAFAARFPSVRLYTPINEIFITAFFSAKNGWWNEQLKTDESYVSALRNLTRANILAKKAILRAQPDAIFIESESSEYFHPVEPKARPIAEALNERRFLSLDLCYGYDVSAATYLYLTDNGMTRAEYEWLMNEGRLLKPFCVMGNDYYWTNEHYVDADGRITTSGEIFGYYVITKQYYERYRLPVMHTETNLRDEREAPVWLRKQWENMLRLRDDGVPIIGFTWYSLTDQIDWDVALRIERGRVNPLGLFDLQRRIRPVGKAYKELIQTWRNLLPLESRSLDLPTALTL